MSLIPHPDDEPIGFDIIDSHTKKVVSNTRSRIGANRVVDHLNNQHGAYRYIVKPIYKDKPQ